MWGEESHKEEHDFLTAPPICLFALPLWHQNRKLILRPWLCTSLTLFYPLLIGSLLHTILFPFSALFLLYLFF